MDATAFMQADVAEQAVTCDVFDETGERAYNGPSESKQDEVDVAIFQPTASALVEIEGSDQEVSLAGLVVPDYDSNGNLVEHVGVNDTIQPQGTQKKYRVETKVGLPNDLSVDLWQLGLNRANDSS